MVAIVQEERKERERERERERKKEREKENLTLLTWYTNLCASYSTHNRAVLITHCLNTH